MLTCCVCFIQVQWAFELLFFGSNLATLKKELHIFKDNWTSIWKKESIDFLSVENEVKNSIAERNAAFEVSKNPIKDTNLICGNEVTF